MSLSLALCVSPQVFREQAIDGETLPLLTEEHLLNNMGLKLGPALKIRSQVGKSPFSEQVPPFTAVPGLGHLICSETWFIQQYLLSNNLSAVLFQERLICP